MYPRKGKRSDEVIMVIIITLWPFIGKIHSITVDNGKELVSHKTMSSILGAPTYFAHPYSSWKHGLNENTNDLIRQCLKKGDSIKELTLRTASALTIQIKTLTLRCFSP